MSASAFIVGIDKYPDSAVQRVLNGAVADAIDFALWALDPAGGNVPADKLYFWIHPQDAVPGELAAYAGADRPWPSAHRPDFKQPPTKQQIILAVSDATDLAAANDPEDRLFVLLAGHGAVTEQIGNEKDPQSCFIAADYIPGSAFGLIPLDKMRRELAHRGPKEFLLFFDCCRNTLPPTIPEPTLDVGVGVNSGLNQNWLVGKAAREAEIAYETKEEPIRGAFSKMLIQGLRQYRVNDVLTDNDLKGFVRKGVSRLIDPKKQFPGLVTRDDMPFDIMLGPPTGGRPELVVKFPPDANGNARLLDGHRILLEELPIVAGEIRKAIYPGQYIVEHAPTKRSKAIFHPGPDPTYETL